MRPYSFSYIQILFFLFLTNYSYAQKSITLYGTITDKETGERLIGANVISRLSKQGAFSSTLGTYNLTIKPNGDSIFISYIGYKTLKTFVNTNIGEQKDFQLTPSAELGMVTVQSQRSNNDRIGVVQLSMKTLQALPSLGGEPDVMKGLQYLPGVKAGSEGSAGIYVRGGTPDQNLVLLDGVPVYNSAHLFGFVSTFNPSVIQNLELTKGGFPARYGGRLASVIDVRTREGNINQFKNEVKIGLVSSHIQTEGPIKKDKASFLISVRRSLYEAYFYPFGGSDNTNYYMGDLNAKIHYTLSKKDHLSFSVYGSKDRYSEKEKSSFGNATINAQTGIVWGNFIANLRWERNWTTRLFSNLVLYKNDYNFSVYSHSKRTRTAVTGQKDTIDIYNIDYNSKIKDWGANWIFYYNLNNAHNIKFGTNLVSHLFTPGVSTLLDYTGNNTPPIIKNTTGINALESRLFVEDNWKIGKFFQLNYGVHSSLFNVRKQQYSSIEPRLSAMYTPSEVFNIKASYTQMKQYLHLLSNSGLGLPTDLWVPPTDKILPQAAQQTSVGIFYHIEDWFDVTLEAYQKTMTGLIDYKEGASFLIQGNDWETKVASNGKGDSRGLELLLERKTPRFSGWLGYTLAKTTRQFDAINKGLPYAYKYDRRHEVSVVGVYKLSERWELSGAFVFSTGNAITLPKSVYLTTAYPSHNFSDGVSSNSQLININLSSEASQAPPVAVFDYGGKNSSRMPNYHRLDVGVNRHKEKRRGDATLNFSIYNVYARTNPYYVKYIFTGGTNSSNGNGNFQIVSLFQFIPAVSWYRRF
jgi:hypothetical protein